MNTELLEACKLCPRRCGVNRMTGQKGYCGADAGLFVARAALHMWEEPCISGERGSGTVFFSGCPLRCIYCQNAAISGARTGAEITNERLADIFLELQQQGAHNINLVTPTHYALHIMDALIMAKEKGLSIPIVYNTGGYESVETIRMLRDYIDIWLTDFKYYSGELSGKLSGAPDYFLRADEALHEMVNVTGSPVFDEDGMMKKGIIVRHLQLPSHLSDSKKIIRYLHSGFHNDIYISIMNQYTPMKQTEGEPSELRRKLKASEYDRLVDYAISLGVEQGFIQDGETADESFIPDFNRIVGIFPERSNAQ